MYLKALPYISCLAVLIAAYVIGHVKGAASCQAQYVHAIEKGISTHDKIESKVLSLPDSTLDRALYKWMRE